MFSTKFIMFSTTFIILNTNRYHSLIDAEAYSIWFRFPRACRIQYWLNGDHEQIVTEFFSTFLNISLQNRHFRSKKPFL